MPCIKGALTSSVREYSSQCIDFYFHCKLLNFSKPLRILIRIAQTGRQEPVVRIKMETYYFTAVYGTP